MSNPRFAPVSIALGRIGLTRIVTSVREAAECILSDEWPRRHGKADTAARKALLGAMEGKVSAEDARAAFEQAAKDAGILMENTRG